MNDDIFKRLKAAQAPVVPEETRPQPAARPKRARRGPWVVLMLLGFAGLLSMFAAGSILAGPALASMGRSDWQSDPQPAPVHPLSFAQVQLPKPTYTPVILPPTVTLPAIDVAADPENEVDTGDSTAGQAIAEAVVYPPTEGYTAPEDDSAGAPAAAYSGGKYILVDISEQHMYVYENDTLVFSFVASTGMNNATATGSFSVLDKIPNAYGSTWDIWMPNWLGIYYAGGLENGIHALPILPSGLTLWAGYLGSPISYGCVVLSSYDAQVLYDWAEIGTPVDIQW